jgi:hypothetical protein
MLTALAYATIGMICIMLAFFMLAVFDFYGW